MYRKTFHLTQHTPLIHFQHDQTGATLRATEVKPKLDRFLLEVLKAKNNGAIPRKNWISDTADRKHLNYRIIIRASGEQSVYLPISPSLNRDKTAALAAYGNRYVGSEVTIIPLSPFFANEDKYKFRRGSSAIDERGSTPEKLRYAILTEGDIILSVASKYPELVQLLSDNVAQFLLTHNFGTRSAKGFGSFTLKGETGSPHKRRHHFTVDANDSAMNRNGTELEKLFEYIVWFYKSLRQGINHGGFRDGSFTPYFYMKPMIFQYAMDPKNGIQWEKKTIKERFFNGKLQAQQHDHSGVENPVGYSNRKKRIVRDVLGLSSDQSWKDYGNPAPTVKKEHHKTENDEEKIERFASPLFFKPIKHPGNEFYSVYFWWSQPQANYLGAEFKLLVNGSDGGYDPLVMWEDFNMDDFMRFAMDYSRFKNSYKVLGGNGHVLRTILDNIYGEITNTPK